VKELLSLAIFMTGWLTGLGTVHATEMKTGFLDRIHYDPAGTQARYVLFVPHEYTGNEPYPLILFMHGVGESGSDGYEQVKVGLGPAIRKQEATFPFIVIFPQSQLKSWQAGSPDARRAIDILAEVQKEYRVDPKRIYLTGLSMGGFGTWSIAAKYPERWAAIVPICGGGNPANAALIKDVPCWCFHGDEDSKVLPQRSREMIGALEAAGGKPKYTEYPGVQHNSWDKSYGTPELYKWLLQQHLK
jgi:predicted peptidase